MAKTLSSMLLKGIGSFKSTHTAALASGSSYQHWTRFSTTASNDSDTHDDFKPTDKLENTGITLKDIIEQDVKENPVMLYMKGDPNRPLCGFSSLAVKILQEYRVPISSRNILEDIELKNAVKASTLGQRFPRYSSMGNSLEGQTLSLTCIRRVNSRRS